MLILARQQCEFLAGFQTEAAGALQIEFPIALIDRNLDLQPPEARVAAQAFVDYCFTPDAQREFAECGFRHALPDFSILPSSHGALFFTRPCPALQVNYLGAAAFRSLELSRDT